MRASGQLDVVAGHVFDLVEKDRCMEVHYTPRGQAKDNVERAHLVVNCIGPETDYRRIDDGLVKTLLQKGLIRPGPADIGIDALPQGAVISRTGTPSRVLYTLGSPMKGDLWEVLAVPEIRLQARQLASTLLRRSAMQGSMR